MDETYEYVTVSIEFTVGNIQPSTGVGNMNDIRSKLSFVLRKALTDLSDADANLRFTSIEGGGIPPEARCGRIIVGGRWRIDGGGGRGGHASPAFATVVSVYYDVTVLRIPNVRPLLFHVEGDAATRCR